MYLYWLDLVGVFAFAFLAARAAIGHGCTALGILICAFLAAVGGGTIREVILNRSPFYFHNSTYLLVISLAAALSMMGYRYFHILKSWLLMLDAVGMVCFAFIGARSADAAQLGLAGTVGFAFLTACGGGIIVATILGQIPRVFKNGTYALPSILLGAMYWSFAIDANHPSSINLVLLTGICGLQFWIATNNFTRVLRSVRRKLIRQYKRHRRYVVKVLSLIKGSSRSSSPSLDL